MIREDVFTEPWPRNLLPFCDWGGGTWSLVHNETRMIYTNDHPHIWSEGYDIEDFFRIWVSDGDLWLNAEYEIIKRQGLDPFTKEPREYTAAKRIGKNLIFTFVFKDES